MVFVLGPEAVEDEAEVLGALGCVGVEWRRIRGTRRGLGGSSRRVGWVAVVEDGVMWGCSVGVGVVLVLQPRGRRVRRMRAIFFIGFLGVDFRLFG